MNGINYIYNILKKLGVVNVETNKTSLGYNIGLDIGVTSVGWAVTDEYNNIMQFRKKNMHGVRLFEEGSTAKARRLSRGTRRRYARRRQRLIWLREIVSEIVLEQDKNFFVRMDEHHLWAQDKSYLSKEEQNSFIKGDYLFNDRDFTDVDYYKQYRTIYHLRRKLMYADEKMDIRLVYLAMHHIIKYRGNFLYQGENVTVNSNISENLEELFMLLQETVLPEYSSKQINIKEIEDLLCEKLLSKKSKQEKLELILSKGLNKEDKLKVKAIVEAIIGYTANYSNLFIDYNLLEEGKDVKLSFTDKEFEAKVENIKQSLGEVYYIVELCQKIYSAIILNDILKGQESLSEAMCSLYAKHGEDLRRLKTLFLKYKTSTNEDKIKAFFRKDEKSVSNYVRYMKDGGCDKINDLYKSIENLCKELKIPDNDPDYRYCLEEMEKEKFLDRINSKNNVAIPYQLHLYELEEIIDNQGRYYPLLLENKDKIISLLKFRIPYYVGPLNNHSKRYWVVRTSGKIYPWNFDQVVDREQSATKFIYKMTNDCTYLSAYKVLPKNSLLYSKYELFNELNKIRVNDKLLVGDIKQKIVRDLFLVYKKVSEKTLAIYLKNYGYKVGNIRGFQKDKEFASSLGVYIDFIKILKDDNLDFNKMSYNDKMRIIENNYDMIEDCIKWITVFEDKEILPKKIKKEYPTLEDRKIKAISSLRYSGWGRLSRELLQGIYGSLPKKDKVTIIDVLEETNHNFMEIINDKQMGFASIIEEEREKNVEDIYKLIDKLAGSPAIKKGIRQSVKLVEEIVKIKGYAPKNIFIEFARSDEPSKRTVSRETAILNMYKKFKEENSEDKDVKDSQAHLTKELKAQKNISNNRKLHLYFLQHGKCLYSGEALDISNLELYEIDHIIPQSYMYDNSIDNTVLVKKELNQCKGDSLVLSGDIIQKMIPYWQKLNKSGLMSDKKFYNLKRANFTENDQERFLNRQLVETRQIIKHVANLLNDCYPDTKVVAIKSALVSDYRKQYKLPKLRDINDYHHAHDAFLASVIGNFILKVFPKYEGEFVYGEFLKKYNAKAKEKNKYGFIVSAMQYDFEISGYKWNAQMQIDNVIKTLNYKGCNITKKLEVALSGGYYNVNPVKPKDNLLPRKRGLEPSLYGGYDGERKAYFVAVVDGKKKNLVGIPIYVFDKIRSKQITEKEYIRSILPKSIILRSNIFKNQLIEWDGFKCTIASHEELTNATQLVLTIDEARKFINMKQSKDEIEKSRLANEFMTLWLEKATNLYSFYENDIKTVVDFFGKGYFDSLCASEKERFIDKILKLSIASPARSDLREFSRDGLALSTRFGRRTIKINLDKVTFVDQSITGLFSRKYKL